LIIWIQNIDADPKFVNGFHLGDSSACIGAGSAGMQLSGAGLCSTNNDIENNARPAPSSSWPDLGAYENSLKHSAVAVHDKGITLHQFMLHQKHPNPFNPTTNISFSLPSKCFATLKVFDDLGREAAVLISKELTAGTYSTWNA